MGFIGIMASVGTLNNGKCGGGMLYYPLERWDILNLKKSVQLGLFVITIVSNKEMIKANDFHQVSCKGLVFWLSQMDIVVGITNISELKGIRSRPKK